MEPEVGRVFLDVDDLQNLHLLVEQVKKSKVVVLLQTRDIMKRPWCIVELYTAIKHHIPIVAVNITGREYDHTEADAFMNHLDTRLDTKAANVIELSQCGDLVDIAYHLSSTIPFVMSHTYNAAASELLFEASIRTITNAINRAQFTQPRFKKEEWLLRR